ISRVETVIRRAYSKRTASDILKIGPLVIDNASHKIKLNGTPLSLTRKEFGLLLLLAKNNGRVYSREQLLHIVWKDNEQSSERTVDTHIKTLCLKQGEDDR